MGSDGLELAWQEPAAGGAYVGGGALLIARGFSRRWHRRIGPWFAIFLALQALSGLAIVFRGEIASLRHPLAGDGPPPSYDQVAQAGRDLAGRAINRIDTPKPSRALWRIYAPREGAWPWLIELDGRDLTPVNQGPLTSYPLDTLFRLHYTWGTDGDVVVFVVGLGTLLITTLGLLAWWPRRNVKAALTPRGPLRQIHGALGAWSAVALIALASTGVFVAASSLIGRDNPRAPPSAKLISLDDAVDLARARIPDRRVTSLRINGATLLVVFADEASLIVGRVWVDRGGAQVMRAEDRDNAPWQSRATDIALRLHRGEALGLFGKILVAVTGALALALAVTGLIERLRPRGAP